VFSWTVSIIQGSGLPLTASEREERKQNTDFALAGGELSYLSNLPAGLNVYRPHAAVSFFVGSWRLWKFYERVWTLGVQP
jgi:hypothetical protein